MAVKIRLMRIGAKKRPFYRVVAVDEKKKRNGKYLELLGTYNPLTEPKEIILKKDRIEYWKKNGAVYSTGFLRIIGEAPQKQARKPKKERVEKSEPDKSEGQPSVEAVDQAVQEPAEKTSASTDAAEPTENTEPAEEKP